MPTGDVQLFIAWWLFVFESVYQEKYIFTVKDAALIAKLVKEGGLLPLVYKTCSMFISEDKFFADKQCTIGMLSAMYNSLSCIKADQCDSLRELGVIPPVGVKFLSWRFWESA